MSTEQRQAEALKALGELGTELDGIQTKFHTTGDLDVAWSRLDRWKRRAERAVHGRLGPEGSHRLAQVHGGLAGMNPDGNLLGEVDALDAYLLGLTETIRDHPEDFWAEDEPAAAAAPAAEPQKPAPSPSSRAVFIVHGHDDKLKEQTARFLERIGLEATILHEKANQGRAIIEKFEDHADVAYAVVLMTGDDEARKRGTDDPLKPRARQNVVFELGFFAGKLGRGRVSVLYEEGVEIPSDYAGVLYIKVDAAGAWRAQLVKELWAASMDFDSEAALRAL